MRLSLILLLFLASRLEAAPPDFETQVAPLLAGRCLGCHSGAEPKGGLNLSKKDLAFKGGDSGAAIVAGKPDDSSLWLQVESNDMPPKKPLGVEEKEILKQWLTAGANWTLDEIDPLAYSSDGRAGLDWWSLQPLQPVTPPATGHPIDALVRAKLQEAGLSPSPPADRRTLIRRLSFDLLGLPPTPEDVEQFLADTSDNATDRLIDRLLKSPHYGERWARHWLDIVRFGETNGFEYDEPRDNFWPYRNWVINAFNADMPYDQFVRQQLAADALAPDDYAAAAATGFLVAGPHNTTLPANAKMRMSMAQDEMEDFLGIVGQTFLALTINCARCHDHKFDPISQQDYYQLASTLGGVTHGQRTIHVPLSAAQQTRLSQIKTELEQLTQVRDQLVEPIREKLIAQRQAAIGKALPGAAPEATATWEFDGNLKDEQGLFELTAQGDAKVVDGALVLDGKQAFATTQLLPMKIAEKTLEAWVKLETLDQGGGAAISLEAPELGLFDAIVYAEQEPKKWMAGSNSFARTKSFQASNPEDKAHERAVHIALVYQADGSIKAYRDGEPYGSAYNSGGLQTYQPKSARLNFGLRHVPAGGNRMLAGRIERAQFYDRALTDEEIAMSAAFNDIGNVPRSLIVQTMSPAEREQLESAEAQLKRLQDEQRSLRDSEKQTLYAVVSAKPPETFVLLRGDVGSPAQEALPRGLRALKSIDPNWQLDKTSDDRRRRLQLANWITDQRNGLLARVIVNRLWQYHFGQGLVNTPSDFGFNGGRPSHPELLDWLAGQLIQNGYHLKAIHRLIVTSQTYQQSSAPNQEALAKDADNKWLWRKSPQRIEAETLRDALLVVTDRLDRQVGGIGYRDMKHYFFKGSHFYDLLSETGPDSRRRTIYRFTPRGATNPFLTTFDCPDPSATSPRRAVTTTPLQALALLNNPMVFELADDFASRAVTMAGSDVDAQIRAVYLIAYNRPAKPAEVTLGRTFVDKHGLAALCRVVFNSNEFLIVP